MSFSVGLGTEGGILYLVPYLSIPFYNPQNDVMNKNSLLFSHTAQDENDSIIRGLFPEPDPDGPVILSRGGSSGKGWKKVLLGATGTGRYLSYRTYDIKDATWFTSEVSEPIICLSIRWGCGSNMRLSADHPSCYIDNTRNFLFWQGNCAVEQQLEAGEHAHLDIFIRPDNLSHLKRYPIINQLIEQTDMPPNGNLIELNIIQDERLDTLMYEVVKEIDKYPPTVERFNYLCDSLLLFAIGENVTIVPPENTAAQSLPKEPKKYIPKPSEKEKLDILNRMDRHTLLMQYRNLYEKVVDRQKLKELEISINGVIKEQATKLWGEKKSLLTGMYLGAAKLFAITHDKKESTPEEKTLLRKAIVKASDLSFALEKPSPVEMAFYMEWSKCFSAPQQLDGQQLIDLLSMVLPNNNIDFTVDSTRRGQNLLAEQLKEAFGLKSMTDIMRVKAEDKPKEIADLYKKLTEHCIDTLELDDKTGVKRSDVVRELDSAYEFNDFISLLHLEIEQLCIQPGYVEKQDDERLRWLIVALMSAEQECEDFFEDINVNPDYAELRLFHALGNNMTKYKKEVQKQVDRSKIEGITLTNELEKVVLNNSRTLVLGLAQFILQYKRS